MIVELYLAKLTFALLKKTYGYVKEVPSINFSYADVNRPLKLKFNDENQKDFFSQPYLCDIEHNKVPFCL